MSSPQRPWYKRRSTWNAVMAGLVIGGLVPAATMAMAGPLIADVIVGARKKRPKPRKGGNSFIDKILRRNK